MNEASRPHDQTVIELLREDPSFADEYLSASLAALSKHGYKLVTFVKNTSELKIIIMHPIDFM